MIYQNSRGRWERLQIGEPLTIAIELDKLRGQGRPRYSKWGVYESKEDKEQKRIIADAWKAIHGGVHHIDATEVEVEITTHRRLPESAPAYREGESDTHKPDIDNVAKSVLDALTGVAWNVDDSAVTKITATKGRRTKHEKDLLTITVRYYTNRFYRKE